MKLIRTWWGATPARSISQAIACDCDDHRDGIAETAAASARKTGELLGQLVERLHDRGLLSDSDILELLPGWQKAE